MSDDRRDFFKKVAGAAVTLASAQAALDSAGATLGAEAGPTSPRALAAAHFALELDGANAGFLHSVEGGHATAEVVLEDLSPDRIIHKHLAGPKYEDIAFEAGAGMSAAFYGWIQDFFALEFTRKDGAIVSAGFDFKEAARLSFTSALLTEIGFPACDASSRDPGFMTVKLSPEVTQRAKGSGSPLAACVGGKVQKKWLPANFRLTIGGLDATRVSKVEALTAKQVVGQAGEGRDEGAPSFLEIPNLVITLAESSAQTWYDWHEDFVIRGNNGQEAERTGMLEYLAPNLQDVLFTLTFFNLGIFKLTPEKLEAGGGSLQRLRAEMYCEQMAFSFGNAAVGC